MFKPKAGSVGQYITALKAFNFSSALIESVGYVFVALGVYKVIEHLSPSASSVLLWTAVITVAVAFIISFITLFIIGWSKNKERQKKQ
jgi:hypothetical protein